MLNYSNAIHAAHTLPPSPPETCYCTADVCATDCLPVQHAGLVWYDQLVLIVLGLHHNLAQPLFGLQCFHR